MTPPTSNPTDTTGAAPVLTPHELSHLGIFDATLSNGTVVAHNVNGPNIICPLCAADPEAQKTCAECAGRGMVGDVPYCARPWDQITERLYVGGHRNQPEGGDAHVTTQFDVVVSLYQQPGYGPDEHIPHHTHAMIDGDLHPDDHPHLHRLADIVVEALNNEQKVLVRCLAGINRSALVAGLALLKLGWTTDEVLTRMRTVRSPYMLFNTAFVDYLRSQETQQTNTGASTAR